MKKILALFALFVPIAAMAGGDICTDLIPDIVNNYELANLEVMRGGNPHVSESLVSCTYKATTPELWGDRPVMVGVLLNTANGRFTVEVN